MRFLKYKILSFLVIFCISNYAYAVTSYRTIHPVVKKDSTDWRAPVYDPNYNYNITQYKKIQINILEKGKYKETFINLYGDGVKKWILDNAEPVLTNMIASIKTPDNATKLDGFEFFIVKKSYNGGGTTSNWSVVDTHLICNTATDGNYRSWDTPIHEFGHGINIRLGTFDKASAICKKYAPFNPAECFAWSSEFWFNTITSAYLKKSIPKQELLNYRTELSNTGVKYVSYFK